MFIQTNKLKFLILIVLSLTITRLYAKEMISWERVTAIKELPYCGNLTVQDKKEILIAVDESLKYLNRTSSKHHYPKNGITHEHVKKSLERFKEILKSNLEGEELDLLIKQEFDFFKSVGTKEKGGVLFTGYFEPLFKGSLEETSTYHYPLYKTPPDIVLDRHHKVKGRKTKDGKIIPTYWTRQDIDNKGVLKGKNLELVYLDNPYDVYMAQFQGSVAVELPNGQIKRFGYSTRNRSTVGFSLAQEMLKANKLTKKELLPSIIADYFYKHPHELPHYLKNNTSYVFFTEREHGPMGALSVYLQKERVIATDYRLFPKAALAFVDLKLYKNKQNHPFQSFVLNQDTGGGVMGPGRCDIFFGTGDEAKLKASDMHSVGQLYFLFLKKKPI